MTTNASYYRLERFFPTEDGSDVLTTSNENIDLDTAFEPIFSNAEPIIIFIRKHLVDFIRGNVPTIDVIDLNQPDVELSELMKLPYLFVVVADDQDEINSMGEEIIRCRRQIFNLTHYAKFTEHVIYSK